MKNEDNTKIKQSLLNSEYLKIFAKISVWIITPVIFSLIIGKFLDTKLNTAPIILVLSLALSFTFSMFMIVKIAKKYMNEEQNNDRK